MAVVNLLSWNIEKVGPKRYIQLGVRSPRATPLLQIIVDTVAHCNASILSILEVAPSVAIAFGTELRQYLNIAAQGMVGAAAAAAGGGPATAAGTLAGQLAARTLPGNAAAAQGHMFLQHQPAPAATVALATWLNVNGAPVAVAQATATDIINALTGGQPLNMVELHATAALIGAAAAEAYQNPIGGGVPPQQQAYNAAVNQGASVAVATAAATAAALPAPNLATCIAQTIAATQTGITNEATAATAAAVPAAVALFANARGGQIAAAGLTLGAVNAAAVAAIGGVGGVAPGVQVAVAADVASSLFAVYVAAAGLAPQPWAFLPGGTAGGETYCLLHRTDLGFRAFQPVPAAPPVTGIDQTHIAGNLLPFPSASSQAGGRRPGYFVFQTTDRAPGAAEVQFSVIAYHAMFSGFSAWGVIRIPQMATIANVTAGGVGYPINAAFVSGDFNVDLLGNPGYYANATALGSAALVPAAGAAARSSLGHWVVSANPLAFRANAYDNIFSHQATTIGAVHQVVDLVQLFTAGNALAHCPGYCNAAFLPVILAGNIGGGPGQLRQTFVIDWQTITAFPPPVVDEGYVACINGASNHLPVLATFTV